MGFTLFSIPVDELAPRVISAIKNGVLYGLFGESRVSSSYLDHLTFDGAAVDKSIFLAAHDAARIVVFGKA